MKITKKVLAVIIAATIVVAGTVFFVIRAFSSNEQTVLPTAAAQTQPAQMTQVQAPVVEPEIVEETPEFSETETTTMPTTNTTAPKKAVTETTTAPEEFVEVSEIAVFSQQDLVINKAPVEETTVKTEENTDNEPVYDDPLPPEGYDWVE